MADPIQPQPQKWALLLDRLAQRTPNINLFFDCCHAGTITRVMPEEEGAEDHGRWLPPPPGSSRCQGRPLH
jgi:hypothetical protein